MTNDSKSLTKDELARRYPDVEWREKLIDILDLVDLLHECVLGEGYKISDALNESVKLSDEGRAVQTELTTKHEVPAKESRLLCLLRTVYEQPLISVEDTDIDELCAALSAEIAGRKILYPFVFGRELYDRACELFEEERPNVGYLETMSLLADQPIGVFQSGRFIAGPYGVVKSSERRRAGGGRRIPLYHCSDVSCSAVHRTHISTDYSAPINENQVKMSRLLRKRAEEPWEWGRFISDHLDAERRIYDDLDTHTLPYLLGDCLSEVELRTLLSSLLDDTKGEFRRSLSALGDVGSAAGFVEGLSRSQMIQLVLMASDSVIIALLDALVLDEVISVPAGEIRIPMVNRSQVSSTYSSQLQLGRYGVRIHCRNVQVGPLRLRRLVEAMYDLDSAADVDELEWQLREVGKATPREVIDEFLRSFAPPEVIRRVVLARRANMSAACKRLGIDEARDWPDDRLVEAIAWKLDFPPMRSGNEIGSFWDLHERFEQWTRAAGPLSIADRQDLRGLASNYFVKLEEILMTCLVFATWSLTTDHVAERRPFMFNLTDETGRVVRKLNEFESERDSRNESLIYTAKPSLYELSRGFGSLAGMLRRYLADGEKLTRSSLAFPKYHSEFGLKSFPFAHTVPFLDLSPSSHQELIEAVDAVSKGLLAAEVNEVRNDQLHFRPTASAELPRLQRALRAVEMAIRTLERTGLTVNEFRYARREIDIWGRGAIVLEGGDGRLISLVQPSKFDWLPLPGQRAAQYVVTGARFRESAEYLRFGAFFDSEYTKMWDGYPRRRRARAFGSPD